MLWDTLYLNHFTPHHSLLPGTFCTNESNWIQGAKCSKKQSDPEGKMCWGAKCSREQNVLRSKKRWGVKCPQGAKCSSAVRKNRCIGFILLCWTGLNWFTFFWFNHISYDRAEIKKIYFFFFGKLRKPQLSPEISWPLRRLGRTGALGLFYFAKLVWTGLRYLAVADGDDGWGQCPQAASFRHY